jgi:hypothetical protein
MSDTNVNGAARKNLLIKALTARGSIYGHVGLGRSKRARNCFRKSHELAKKAGDTGLIGLTRGKLGVVK